VRASHSRGPRAAKPRLYRGARAEASLTQSQTEAARPLVQDALTRDDCSILLEGAACTWELDTYVNKRSR
jgi:hypothetical protein